MVQREFEQRFGRHACAGRPSPTRAGVNSADPSANGTTAPAFSSLVTRRDGCFAQSHRVIRCILLAAGGRSREHDQVMRDQRHRYQTLDIAAPQPRPRKFPEHFPVVAEDADFQKIFRSMISRV